MKESNRIHKIAHLGINKTVARIRSLMYWPRMSTDIANFVGKCSICQMFQNKRTKEPLLPSKTPLYPFQCIGMDIGEYRGHIFLAVEDYYSRWLEIITLKNKSAKEIICKLKTLFSKFGIPETVRCDNNPFASSEMRNFAKTWGFRVITSSPHHSKSNGLSEKGVGISKKLIKKSIQGGSDLQLALLEYRATPLTGLDYSPSQLMMGRLLRTSAPATLDLLVPNFPSEEIRTRMEEIKLQSKKYYDRSAKKEETFQEEQPIYIQDTDGWKEGWVSRKLEEPRSYVVRDQTGQELRRNSVFLRGRETIEQPPVLSPQKAVLQTPRKTGLGSKLPPPSTLEEQPEDQSLQRSIAQDGPALPSSGEQTLPLNSDATTTTQSGRVIR
ncbi:transmembrane protein 33-containing Krueppel homolog 2 isoform X1 [Rhodnius prolixus]|uniref:transmembrane protein 33-containing Krueppel homolog 2 isoform X1 n=1 Tax=Rhodnius prolixus TaxID=13249 RepID=UPI003D18B0D9